MVIYIPQKKYCNLKIHMIKRLWIYQQIDRVSYILTSSWISFQFSFSRNIITKIYFVWLTLLLTNTTPNLLFSKFQEDFYSTALKTLISVSTVILLGLIVAYHGLEVQVIVQHFIALNNFYYILVLYIYTKSCYSICWLFYV